MSKIFISYRRDDSSGYAQAIYRELVQRFSKDRVFMDVDTVKPGVDFVDAIEKSVGECDVLLALIGNKWASQDTGTKSRLENQKDFVRLEISTALARDIRIIPILVDGMKMPSEEMLPGPLKPLLRRNAMEISHTRFNYDVERVVKAVSEALGNQANEGETDVLEHLRKQMLSSFTSWELRQSLYELEAYLANNPHSAEGRLLKDKMQDAMRRAEQMEQPAALEGARSMRPSLVPWLIALAALGIIAYALLLVLGLF
jgi:hypothetical protein